jgi:hypothetical protein
MGAVGASGRWSSHRHLRRDLRSSAIGLGNVWYVLTHYIYYSHT